MLNPKNMPAMQYSRYVTAKTQNVNFLIAYFN